MNQDKKVAFVLGCVDCRHHVSEAELIAQLKIILGVDDVYLCTTAGPDGVMVAREVRHDAAMEDAIIIRDAKNATVFAVLGHYGCAGHPVSDEQHDADTVSGAKNMSATVETSAIPLIFFPRAGQKPTWGIKRLDSAQVIEEDRRQEVAA